MNSSGVSLIVFVVLFVCACVIAGMVGCPTYNVYLKHKEGEGEFAQAEANRKILVQTAEAREEAAKHDAQAEVERAKGVAESNKIIGDSLKGNEAYLHYLWIDSLRSGGNDTIYIPTEANLPILESGRLGTDAHRAILNRDRRTAMELELSGEHVQRGGESSTAVRE